MSQCNSFSCYLIGEKSRLIQCTELLLAKGHVIYGIISSNTKVIKWAKDKGLEHISSNSDICEFLKRKPFDLFFSIDNLVKIPKEALNSPKVLAINFHDGPLPKYAGNNATNWALINQEKTHGVTWHVMTDVIDAGNILKQKLFSIADDETALTLNGICYEKSLESFSELIDELSSGIVQPITQNIDDRSFFSLWKRPYAAAIIDWALSAEAINGLFRALQFGSYPNPLALPKVIAHDRAVIVSGIAIVAQESTQLPGTITHVSDEVLHVATGSRDLALTEFVVDNGSKLSPSAFCARYGLYTGYRFPCLDNEFAKMVTTTNSKSCKHEAYWVNRLYNLSPPIIPYSLSTTVADMEPLWRTRQFSLPPVNGLYDEKHKESLQIALLVYIGRLTCKETYDVAYRDNASFPLSPAIEMIFETHLPLRVDFPADLTLGHFRTAIRESIAELVRNGPYMRDILLRYAELREKSAHRSSSRLPIAIEMVNSLSDYKHDYQADISIVIPDSADEILWVYNERVLDATYIDRMWNQFITLYAGLTGKDDQLISGLSILTEPEKNMLFNEWAPVGKNYPTNCCLQQLFERQVEKTPDAIALEYEGLQLTYSEFNSRSNRLALKLQSLGVGPEAIVGLFMERSLDLLTGIYGILKAGGAYLPLDPQYPEDRLAFMLSDADVHVVVTQNKYREQIDAIIRGSGNNSIVSICIDSEPETEHHIKTSNAPHVATSHNAAYIIYTSGSTGKPKGVVNEHRGIVNRLLWMQDEYSLNESDCVLQKTPFTFDVSVWEFFWPLLCGSKLVIAPPGLHRDPDGLAKVIIRENITTIHFVPSMLQLFLEGANAAKCTCLKRVICSGEALSFELQERFFKIFSTVELHNLYGPTEAAVDVTYWRCRQDNDRRIVPIGKPVANTPIYILDKYLHPVPPECTGELHIGGIQVARSYLNRPELTAEKFIHDPFAATHGARLYKTGDLARHLPDGSIEYLGRIDFQVKIRGLRIELGEIEARACAFKGVSQCIVNVHEDALRNQILVAYYTELLNCSINSEELRIYLQKSLPDYMVPQYLIKLETIPLSPNGKADRKALPSPKFERNPFSKYVSPSRAEEETVATIWKELLGLDQVGIDDSFFDLGGHSLLIIQMVGKLKKMFEKEIKITDLFRYPTIRKLVEYLTEEKKTDSISTKSAERAKKQQAAMRKKKEFVRAIPK